MKVLKFEHQKPNWPVRQTQFLVGDPYCHVQKKPYQTNNYIYTIFCDFLLAIKASSFESNTSSPATSKIFKLKDGFEFPMPNVRRPSIEVTPPPNSKQTARFELDTLAPLYPNNHPLSQRARVLSESMQPRPTLISPSTPTGKSLPQVLSLEI